MPEIEIGSDQLPLMTTSSRGDRMEELKVSLQWRRSCSYLPGAMRVGEVWAYSPVRLVIHRSLNPHSMQEGVLKPQLMDTYQSLW